MGWCTGLLDAHCPVHGETVWYLTEQVRSTSRGAGWTDGGTAPMPVGDQRTRQSSPDLRETPAGPPRRRRSGGEASEARAAAETLPSCR